MVNPSHVLVGNKCYCHSYKQHKKSRDTFFIVGKKKLSALYQFSSAFGPTHFPVQLSTVVKWQHLGAAPCLPPDSGIKTDGAIPSPPNAVMAWCLLKKNDNNFTFCSLRLLRRFATYASSLSTFRDSLSVPSLRVKQALLDTCR